MKHYQLLLHCIAGFFGLFLFSLTTLVFANPYGSQVVRGQVTMSRPDPATLNIRNSPNAIINWKSFSIGPRETTRFIQQNSSSAILNRVKGENPSALLGRMLSNGRVFLINPNGMVFGPNAVIDTAGFIGSTLNIKDDDFLAGRLNFEGTPDAGPIENQGLIQARDDGGVYLIAPSIENSGIIRTESGTLVLAAGRKITVSSLDLDHISFEIQAPEDEVVNVGKLLTSGGAMGVFAGTIRNHGHIEADTLARDAEGNIKLVAQAGIELEPGSEISASGPGGGHIHIESETGTTLVSGAIEARGLVENGGEVQLLGAHVALNDITSIDVSGEHGGGTVLVGGDYKGQGEVRNATTTYVGPDVAIDASASTEGDGGKVIIWADDSTQYDGAINVRGGELGGDGGFVEVSGKKNLGFDGTVDASAPEGDAGTLLLDPLDIIIFDASIPPGQEISPITNDDELDPDVPKPGDPEGQILAGDGGPQDVFFISEQALEDLPGNIDIILEATNNIAIEILRDDILEFNATADGSVTFRADAIDNDTFEGGGFFIEAGEAGQSIQTQGGAITIEGAEISVGTPSPPNPPIIVQSVPFNALDPDGVEIRTGGGNINLHSTGDINKGFYLNASSDSGTGGDISITGILLDLTGPVLTKRADITIDGNAINLAGPVESSGPGGKINVRGPIRTNGNDLKVIAGDILAISDDIVTSGGNIELSSETIGINTSTLDSTNPDFGSGVINLSPTTRGSININRSTLITDKLTLGGLVTGISSLTLLPATTGKDIDIGSTTDTFMSANNIDALSAFAGHLSVGGTIAPAASSTQVKAGDMTVVSDFGVKGDLTLVSLGDIVVNSDGSLQSDGTLTLAALGDFFPGSPGNISDTSASKARLFFDAPDVTFFANNEAGTQANPLNVKSGSNTVNVGAGTGVAYFDGAPGNIIGSGPVIQDMFNSFNSIGINLDEDILNTTVKDLSSLTSDPLCSDCVPPEDYPPKLPGPPQALDDTESRETQWNSEVSQVAMLDQWMETGTLFPDVIDMSNLHMETLIVPNATIVAYFKPIKEGIKSVNDQTDISKTVLTYSLSTNGSAFYTSEPETSEPSNGRRRVIFKIPGNLEQLSERGSRMGFNIVATDANGKSASIRYTSLASFTDTTATSTSPTLTPSARMIGEKATTKTDRDSLNGVGITTDTDTVTPAAEPVEHGIDHIAFGPPALIRQGEASEYSFHTMEDFARAEITFWSVNPTRQKESMFVNSEKLPGIRKGDWVGKDGSRRWEGLKKGKVHGSEEGQISIGLHILQINARNRQGFVWQSRWSDDRVTVSNGD